MVTTRMRPRRRGPWTALFCSAALVLSGCRRDTAPAPPDRAGRSTTLTPSLASSPVDLAAALKVARSRFNDAPPSIRGTYEYRSERETLTYELWIDWPAFRLSLTGEEHGEPADPEKSEPFVVATLDGERFGVRDPASDSTYVTHSFGEGQWILGPVLAFFGEEIPPWCVDESVVEVEEILGRPAIRIRCSDFEALDAWIDDQTGLLLRQEMEAPNEHEPGWSGFVRIEFDPVLDESLFDPESV
jgi:hypothetical protein